MSNRDRHRQRDGDSDRDGHQDQSLPTRTAWHVLHRIRETWDGRDRYRTGTVTETGTGTRSGPAPPPWSIPHRSRDTPEDIARALMSSPPKKRWRYLEGK